MPKKTRKMKQRAALRRGGVALPEDSAPEMEGAPADASTRVGASRAFSPVAHDYAHIYRDLKRIALFAIFFFAVLIALSFVIK